MAAVTTPLHPAHGLGMTAESVFEGVAGGDMPGPGQFRMNFISCFSGIEAASAAWIPLGFHCLAVAEMEPSSCAVLAHHYPDVPNLGDVLAESFLDRIQALMPDIIVGGPPCQDFSVAGLRAGLNGHRGNLTLRWVQIIHASRAKFALTENVPGWLSANDGHAFGAFLAGLVGHDTDLLPPKDCGGRWTNAGMVDGPGGRAAWRILDAQYFGLAQRRKRVFVVFCPRNGGDPAQVLFESQGLRGDTSARRTPRERIADSLTRGADSGGKGGDHENIVANPLGAKRDGGWRGDLDNDTYAVAETVRSHPRPGSNTVGNVAMALNAHGGSGRMDGESETFVANVAPALSMSNPYGDHESREGLLVATALRASSSPKGHGQSNGLRGDGSDNLVTHSLRADGFDASEDGTGRGIPLVTAFNHKASAHQSMNPGAISPTLDIGKSDGVCVAFQSSQSGVRDHDTHATLDANNGSRRHNGAVVNSAVRRLTPLECCRLQGFSDDYFDNVLYREKPLADGPRYRLLGNSMAVPVMAHIGRRIAAVFRP